MRCWSPRQLLLPAYTILLRAPVTVLFASTSQNLSWTMIRAPSSLFLRTGPYAYAKLASGGRAGPIRARPHLFAGWPLCAARGYGASATATAK